MTGNSSSSGSSKSKWDITINKVEGTPSPFGKSGAHICLPKEWLKETVVVVPKKTWDELQKCTRTGMDEKCLKH